MRTSLTHLSLTFAAPVVSRETLVEETSWKYKYVSKQAQEEGSGAYSKPSVIPLLGASTMSAIVSSKPQVCE